VRGPLIVLLGTPTPANALHLFHRAWTLMALTGATAAVTALALGHVRASHTGEETFTSTSTITPFAAAPRTR
jgi:hypothetical protein